MIYFIRDVGTGCIKIGSSSTPWKRLRYLQTGCPGTLEIAAIVDGGEDEERRFHTQFSAERFRGEWFRGDLLLGRFVASQPKPVVPINSDRGIQARISEATGINNGIISELCSGKRRSAAPLAEVYQVMGIKLGVLSEFSDEQVTAWALITGALRAKPDADAEAA